MIVLPRQLSTVGALAFASIFFAIQQSVGALSTRKPTGASANLFQEMLTSKGFQVETQFLVISSPSLGKIVYTRLSNFQSSTGRSYSLIDSGLQRPMGISLDRNAGSLFVADIEAEKVYCYTLVVDKKDPERPSISATNRITVLVGHPYKWVSVDDHGNVWYTSTDTNNINKITKETMNKLRGDEFRPQALVVVSEKSLEAGAAAEVASEAANPDNSPTDPPEALPQVFSMYEGEINEHVSTPGMLLADGQDLFWTNLENGTGAGSIVMGSTDPHIDPNIGNQTSGVQPFPARVLTKATDSAYGLAVAGSVILYTSNTSAASSGSVFCVERNGDANQKPLKMVEFMETPRGIVWDKDYTAYVADEATGKIYSFPTGRLMENAPVTTVVDVLGAYGVAMFSESDKAFSIQGNSGAQRSSQCFTALLLTMAGSIGAMLALG